MKFVFLPLALIGFTYLSANTPSEAEIKIIRDNSVFVLNEYETNRYEITGVKEEFASYYELRVYSKELSDICVDKIAENAFASCDYLSSLMITSDITYIDPNAFNNLPYLEYINFTGSEAQYKALNINPSLNYATYANDEGFLNYWNEFVRMEDTTNLCDIGKDIYLNMKDKYNLLSQQEKDYVNVAKDRAGIQIKSSIDYLEEFFKETPSNPSQKREMNKSTAIALIVTASIIGMTSISLFFFLKTKNIID